VSIAITRGMTVSIPVETLLSYCKPRQLLSRGSSITRDEE
jgi:hypothetical protein